MSDIDNAVREVPRARVPAEQASGNDVPGGGSVPARSTGDFDGPEAWVPPAAVAAVQGFVTQRRWKSVRDVRDTMERILKPRSDGTSLDQWLRDKANYILSNRGPTGRDGAFGQLSGHLFERLDIDDYNLRREGGYRLEQRPGPHAPGYDASRFDADGRFAGAVQLKLGPTGIPKAIKKLEARTSGSAKNATFRVPYDQFNAAEKAARGRTRVRASYLNAKTVIRIEDEGLRDLATRGEAAASLSRQAGRAAARSAAVGMVVGGLVDLRAFVNGDLNVRQFVARRGVDAAQAGITAATTTIVIRGVADVAESLASRAVPGTLASRLMGTVAASTVVAPAVVAAAVAYGVSRAANPVRRYVTDQLDSPPCPHGGAAR